MKFINWFGCYFCKRLPGELGCDPYLVDKVESPMKITREIFYFPKPNPNVVPTAIKRRSHFLRKCRRLICVDTYKIDVALLVVTLLVERMILATECHIIGQCIVRNITCVQSC